MILDVVPLPRPVVLVSAPVDVVRLACSEHYTLLVE